MIIRILKSSIALYCEGLWLYYGFILFIKLQWQVVTPQVPLLWVVAGGLGLGICSLLRYWGAKSWVVYIAFATCGVLLLYLFLNHNVETNWKYLVAGSFLLLCVYFRGVYFALKEPVRNQMLLKLEGTILFYFFFVLIQLGNRFTTNTLHVTFAVALIFGLIGMVLTLGESHEGPEMLTQTVGNAKWIVYPSIIFIVLGLVCSGLFLLPASRAIFTQGVNGLVTSIFAIGHGITIALKWLIHLLPVTEDRKPMNLPGVPSLGPTPGNQTRTAGDWFGPTLTGFIIIIVFSSLLYLVRLLKRYPFKALIKSETQQTPALNWRSLIQAWFKHLLARIRRKFRSHFSHFYLFELYFQYHQFLRWGKKMGIPRMNSETPNQYAKRVCKRIEATDQVRSKIKGLSTAFAEAYYSGDKHVLEEGFEGLIKEIKQVPLRELEKKKKQDQ